MFVLGGYYQTKQVYIQTLALKNIRTRSKNIEDKQSRGLWIEKNRRYALYIPRRGM